MNFTRIYEAGDPADYRPGDEKLAGNPFAPEFNVDGVQKAIYGYEKELTKVLTDLGIEEKDARFFAGGMLEDVENAAYDNDSPQYDTIVLDNFLDLISSPEIIKSHEEYLAKREAELADAPGNKRLEQSVKYAKREHDKAVKYPEFQKYYELLFDENDEFKNEDVLNAIDEILEEAFREGHEAEWPSDYD
jgi:hypothetical protein